MITKNYYGNDPRFAKAYGSPAKITAEDLKQEQARLDSFPYINDSVVSLASGIAKFPSDVGSLFNLDWANSWEDKVNIYRNQNQSSKLNTERILAMEALNNNESLIDVAKKFPYATSQYLFETGVVPAGSTIKGVKTAKNIYTLMNKEKSFNRIKKANNVKYMIPSGIAYAGSIPAQSYGYNIYRDYQESRGNNG